MEREIDLIAKYWDDYSPDFDEAHNTEDLALWRQQLLRLTDGKTGLKTLDIGTGTGFLALMLAELGNESYGVDIAEKMMELGKEHARERGVTVHYLLCEGEHLPFEDDSFDVVVNCRLLWTLMEPEISLREWLRVLRPGGKMLGFMRRHDPDRVWSHTIYEGDLDSRMPLRNAKNETYLAYLEAAGYVNAQVLDMPPELTVRQTAKDGGPIRPWVCVYGEK